MRRALRLCEACLYQRPSEDGDGSRLGGKCQQERVRTKSFHRVTAQSAVHIPLHRGRRGGRLPPPLQSSQPACTPWNDRQARALWGDGDGRTEEPPLLVLSSDVMFLMFLILNFLPSLYRLLYFFHRRIGVRTELHG